MKMSMNSKVNKIVFGNHINHVVGYWLLSFANLYIRDYDSPEEKRKEVSDSLSERATPLQRHSLLETIYIHLFIITFPLAVILLPLGYLVIPEGRPIYLYLVAVFTVINFFFLLSAYLGLRCRPSKEIESIWVNSRGKADVKVEAKHSFLNIDYLVMVPICLIASFVLSLAMFAKFA